MTPKEFEIAFPKVMGWIKQILWTHRAETRPVIKFVVVDRVPMPPLSSIGLSRFSEFERGDYDGITYLDTYFLKKSAADDETLHFHEMIHIVQWRLLGAEFFLAMYAGGLETFGYRNSPLEKMAYDAQELFARSAPIFDAEAFVAQTLRP